MSEYKRSCQAKMKTASMKLLAQLKREHNIDMEYVTEPADNMVFTQGDKRIEMSHHSYFRYSGMASITRDKKGANNESESIPVTEEMWMQQFVKPIILTLLEKS